MKNSLTFQPLTTTTTTHPARTTSTPYSQPLRQAVRTHVREARTIPSVSTTPTASTSVKVGPCRLASLLINQHTGTPFFPDLHPDFENVLPAEQALWAVGLKSMGDDRSVRVALYGIDEHPRFLFHGELNQSGAIQLGHRSGGISDAKLAALHFVVGALLGAARPGTFDLDPAFLEAGRHLDQRRDYAAARAAGACALLFTKHCQPLPASADDRTLQLPRTIPLLSPDQLPAGVDPAKLPVTRFTLTPAALRSYALNRFSLGLARPEGEFHLIRRRFARQFEEAQAALETLDRDGQEHAMERAVRQTKRDALRHLAAVRLPEAERPARMAALAAAIQGLRTFYRHRDTEDDNRVVLYAPGRVEASNTGLLARRDDLFACPMFRAVSGFPVQVLDGFMSDRRFPEDGRELAALR